MARTGSPPCSPLLVVTDWLARSARRSTETTSVAATWRREGDESSDCSRCKSSTLTASVDPTASSAATVIGGRICPSTSRASSAPAGAVAPCSSREKASRLVMRSSALLPRAPRPRSSAA
eukprot:scaffold230984_cov31-Tisochrysis_lutea.AAC.3